VEEGSFFGDLWEVVQRRRSLIAVVAVATFLMVGAVTFTTPPVYTASTLMLIETTTPQIVNIDRVLGDRPGAGHPHLYETQYGILASRSVAALVIRETGLTEQELPGGTSALGRVRSFVAGADEPEIEEPASLERGVPSELIDTYLDNLDVSPVKKSRLARLAFSALDPKTAARVANAHAQAYIDQGMNLRRDASAIARDFLEVRLTELKQRLETSETALNDYRRREGILSLDTKENLVVEQLAELHSQLTQSEANRITLESQYRAVRKRSYDSLPAVQSSELIRTLKEELARFEAEEAYLKAQFKPGRGPQSELAQIAARIEQTRGRIASETASIVKSIESAFLIAKAREDDLRARVEQQKTAALALKDASVEYAILAREADTNRELYESVLQRMKEIGVTSQLHASNVFVIDEAHPPRAPSAPNKGQALALALVLGLVGGVGLAYGVEQLDNTVRTASELEGLLEVPCLASVPDFQRLGSLDKPRGDRKTRKALAKLEPGAISVAPDATAHGASAALDAYRAIRTGILLSRAGEAPRTILFTSASRGEGKTATVLNTAMAFAQTGGRVLVIDADLRRPSCHRILGVEPGAGLTEVLTGHADAEPLIQETRTPLFFLPAGNSPPNPTELLGSDTMHETLLDVRTRYQYVLIDAPPILNISDAIVLSTLVDGVVMVVDQANTPKPLVREAHSKLIFARAPLLGTVFNRADPRAMSYDPYTMEASA